MAYWLFKSEPETFNMDTLWRRPKHTEHWDGVRNYQARNMLRDEIKQGDQAFFYYSNCAQPGIAGIVEVVGAGYPDFTAWDPQSPYFDEKSPPESPRWYMVDVRFKQKFKNFVSLQDIKQQPNLQEMVILRKGNRLSITPVSSKEWLKILKLGQS